MFNEILNFLKEFGAIINLLLVIGVCGLYITLIQAKNDSTIIQKNERISLLEKQLEIQGGFVIEKTTERFQKLKEYYEIVLNDWYQKSLQALENEYNIAVQKKEKVFQENLLQEISLRKKLIEKYKDQEQPNTYYAKILLVSPDFFVGTYSISGSNPRFPTSTRVGQYLGKLIINREGDTFKLRWIIESLQAEEQEFFGRGILTMNILSAIFFESEKSDEASPFGLISYEILSDEILRGTWTGWSIDIVGTEQLRRVIF